jgi:hypothetical protein
MKAITLNRLNTELRSTSGRFFTVTYRKLDGSIRKMNARLGVRKGVKGTGRALRRNDRMRVWDRTKEAFRTVNVDRIIELRAEGTVTRPRA